MEVTEKQYFLPYLFIFQREEPWITLIIKTVPLTDPKKAQEPLINLSKVVIRFNKDQLEELKEAFKLFGRVRDGKILYSQFGDMMGALGQNPTNAKVLRVLGNPKSDELKSQHVDLKTFLPMLQAAAKNRNQGTYEDYLEGLHVFDNSKVRRAELRQALTTLGEKIAEEKMETVLAGHEVSNGCINYEAFLKHPKRTELCRSLGPRHWPP
uniref:myosin light chain 6B-like n=1 Tax=Callithrix jacchus TaxID=9483 RepID=UPI0023DD0D4C|nr:myosin light chain 6B-like [Callithrix jacchus]